jgi:hypothetical protein
MPANFRLIHRLRFGDNDGFARDGFLLLGMAVGSFIRAWCLLDWGCWRHRARFFS